MQSGNRFEPDSCESFAADFGRQRRMPGCFPPHVVAVKTPHDMHRIADAERVGQVMQVTAGDAALDLVTEVLEQA